MALGRPVPAFLRFPVPVLAAVTFLYCGPTEEGDGRLPPTFSRDGGSMGEGGGTPPADSGRTCTLRSSGKSWGPDGCGGMCGFFPANSTCNADGASYGCAAMLRR